MDIASLVALISEADRCIVLPAAGPLTVGREHVIPDDIAQFYSICGGVSLGIGSPYAMSILPPSKVALANPLLVGGVHPEDISSTWYTIAQDPQGNFLTIDLHRSRQGRCYDSFFDRHGIVGSCAIVAVSFTDLLNRLWLNREQYWYWLRDDFASLGDAYD